jgi:hypothetical protein
VKKGFLFFICLFLAFIPGTVRGQTSTSTSGTEMKSLQFDTSGFPGWARDLRRAEIVAFGSFPFTFLFANLGVNIYRTASHNWDSRYYAGPMNMNSPDSVEMTQDELVLVMSVAAAGSVVISLADYFIVKYKQHKRERELAKAAGETPIILRSRLSIEEEGSEGEGDPPEAEGGSF